VEEEWINSLAILAAVASCRGSGDAIGGILRNALVETDVAETDANTGQDQSLSDVVHSTAGWHIHHAELPTGPCVVCAGSFNPLHPAHIRLLELARSMTHLPGYFELSITNVDKPPLDFIEIEKRMRQFEQQQLSLMLTNRPRYLGKAELFPIGSYFVMGSDTYARLVDQRYYGNAENPLERFEARQTKFIVAARRQDHGTVLGGEDILRSLHETDAHQASRWSQITLCIPREEFLMDVSSSAIRGGQLKI
jgi:nicotinic acid mononucleotide adenylyltransferase